MTVKSRPHKLFVGIGSNLNQPKNQVQKAVKALADHPELTLVKQSCWYQSKAVGPGNQPDYINGAVMLECTTSAELALDIFQQIENTQGRERHLRWGARTLDLDILLFDDACIESHRLTIPHPEIGNRNFVMRPLLDLDNKLTMPDGRYIADMLHIIGEQNLEKITT